MLQQPSAAIATVKNVEVVALGVPVVMAALEADAVVAALGAKAVSEAKEAWVDVHDAVDVADAWGVAGV